MGIARLVIFASGNGSNFEAIVQAINEGRLNATIVGLICDQPNAYCLVRAKKHVIDTYVVERKSFKDKTEMDKAILNQCIAWQADWLILAGYMRLITEEILRSYPRHILNIHPSLLPKYRGKDALGQALAAHETTLGVSIHFVDEGMDTGEIIAQFPFTIGGDEPRSQIEETLHRLEHRVYPEVIQQTIQEERK